MLSVAKLARGREEYYLATVASGREGAGGLIEPDGRWLGQAAASLGLAGSVEGPDLRALLAGIDPVSGEVLSTRHAQVRVAAYDCTYSTPKSVSVLHALGAEDVRAQIRAGHEQAAEAALGYLERRGARVCRVLAWGEAASSLPAGGFVAASFLHRASRAPDPHLHSHVLVANLAPGPDGRWSALDARGLYLELRTARDLYETQLRSELTGRLGVSWRRLNGAWADLAGIDPTVNRAFSRRSTEIEEALELSGRSGPLAARIASAKTRPAKDFATPYEELVVAWRERAYALGVSDSRLSAVTGRSRAASDGPGAELVEERRGRESWVERTLGDQGVAARDGTCRRGELLRSRCASLPNGGEVEQVESDVEELLDEGRIIPVPPSTRSLGPRLKTHSGRSIPGGACEQLYTTPAVLEINERLQRLARDNPGAIEILSYHVGGRLEALDTISEVCSRSLATVTAVAPGRRVAACFEAATGIETVSVADTGVSVAEPGLAVLAEAQCLGPWELSSVVESSLAVGGRVLLVAPSAALDVRHSAAAALASHLVPRLPGGTGDMRFGLGRGKGGPERQCFAGREVLVVSSCSEEREALVERWRQTRAEGRHPLVVASDDAVVRALRDAVRDLGGSPGDVVESRRLCERHPPSGFNAPVLMLGALPAGFRDVAPDGCVHVAVVSPQNSGAQRLGRAAEVARPSYLLSELGPVQSGIPDRRAWRAGAAALEGFRRKWSIDDREHAVGDRATLRSHGSAALIDVVEVRHKIRGHPGQKAERPQRSGGSCPRTLPVAGEARR
jgi:conjugative relaxase-like TrwC/TraI family protein